MSTFTRRGFVAAAALAPLARLQAAPLGWPVGFQSWTVRELLAKDFAGTLKMMAGLGYGAIEMCSPPGYRTSGFGSLEKLSAAEMKAIVHDAGLVCESCHYGFPEFQKDLEPRIAFAKELGLKQMVLSSFWLPKEAKLDDYRRSADTLNACATKIRAAGMACGFHNHHMEFAELEGVLIYDELMRRLDPKLVQMQFQVAVVSLGYQAVDMYKKFPGRFLSLHLADWSKETKKGVPVGQGVVDWKGLFAGARAAGVKNYFVEMDLDQMKESITYLKNMKA